MNDDMCQYYEDLSCFGLNACVFIFWYSDVVYDVLDIFPYGSLFLSGLLSCESLFLSRYVMICESLFLSVKFYLCEFISLWVWYFCGVYFSLCVWSFYVRLGISKFCCSMPLMFLVKFILVRYFHLKISSEVALTKFFFLSRCFMC